MDVTTGYCNVEDYGIIGDMHTCALVSKTGSLDFMCWPVFDSPSVFCRILDKDKGGYFSIRPKPVTKSISKQNYLPYTNMLETRWICEDGAASVLDFFPVSNTRDNVVQGADIGTSVISGHCPCKERRAQNYFREPIRHSALLRRITCSRGMMQLDVEVFPAFNYACDHHTISGCPEDFDGEGSGVRSVVFDSLTEKLRVDIHVDGHQEYPGYPEIQFKLQDKPGLLGKGLVASVKIAVDQSVTFTVHSEETFLPKDETALGSYFERLENRTYEYWTSWTRKCTFRGHYREQVERSMLVLKLLTYEPTGAIVAAPTFSLPEAVRGTRNWDYRYSWIRDTMFTLYVFLENGYSAEAESYMTFIFDRIIPSVAARTATAGKEQLLPIVFTIRGELEIPEIELNHLEGYRGSRPVRIGNAATSHTQLDTFGALLDSIYLYNKYSGPISFDQWMAIRLIVNHILRLRNEPDMSIWEVRGPKQNFVFSKIMLWVTLDRAVRLADKRSNLPCPERTMWVTARDEMYLEIMEKGYNKKGGFFCMSYENQDLLDASVLIAPLVLFIAPDDPRMMSTLHKIMQKPEQGGLTSSKMVSRYDHEKAADGVGGEEGAFLMVTFWLIEAMSRASRAKIHPQDHPHLLELRKTATNYFENALSFANHLGMFSEELDMSGEQRGNTPQAFSHLACVSAAMNLARM